MDSALDESQRGGKIIFCPQCHKPLTAFLPADGNCNRAQRVGDFSICFSCYTFLVFTSPESVRELTPVDVEQMLPLTFHQMEAQREHAKDVHRWIRFEDDDKAGDARDQIQYEAIQEQHNRQVGRERWN